MTRYIDADLLMEKKIHHYALDYDYVTTDDIDDTPTADVVEVVRCGECEYLYTDGKCDAFADFSIRPSASDFCSYGKRRE